MKILLLIIAIICFVFAAFGFNPSAHFAIGWMGLAFFAASFLPVPGP